MIIGFSGYARAGKDTCADIICRTHRNYCKISFAEELKSECNAMMATVGRDINFYFEDDKIRHRDFLVFWGKYCREHFGTGYWVAQLERSMDSLRRCNGTESFVVSDVRYPNEVEWIRANGGVVIYVRRPGTGAANDEEERTIGEILSRGLYDYGIDNDGTIDTLRRRLDHLFRMGYVTE